MLFFFVYKAKADLKHNPQMCKSYCVTASQRVQEFEVKVVKAVRSEADCEYLHKDQNEANCEHFAQRLNRGRL